MPIARVFLRPPAGTARRASVQGGVVPRAALCGDRAQPRRCLGIWTVINNQLLLQSRSSEIYLTCCSAGPRL